MDKYIYDENNGLFLQVSLKNKPISYIFMKSC